MADLDITQSMLGNHAVTLKGSQIPVSAVNDARFQTIATLKTYLEANGYTAAQTAVMSKNDLIFAARHVVGSALTP